MAGLPFQGMIFEISPDDVTYTSIGCITGYDLGGGSRTEIDTTCSTSTEKEYLLGLRDAKTMSLDLNYDPEGAGLAIAEASEASDALYYFRITYANSAGVSGTLKKFQGQVMNTGESGSTDDKLSGTIEVKVRGAITKTPAA